MSWGNYDKKVIAIFDTIGSFFVDTFYNGHYIRAREYVKTGRGEAITDAYRDAVLNYMNGIKKRSDLYGKTVHNIHEFYQKSMGAGSILLSEFEDKFLSQFIPAEYYRDFTNANKDAVLREIIVTAVMRFGQFTLSKTMFPLIIDDHMNRNNIKILQDKIIDIFITQREEYYTKFANEVVRKNGADRVDLEIFNRLKEEFVNEKRLACELAANHERAINTIKVLSQHIHKLQAEIDQLKANRVKYPTTPYPSPRSASPSRLPPDYAPIIEDAPDEPTPPTPEVQHDDKSAVEHFVEVYGAAEEDPYTKQRAELLASLQSSKSAEEPAGDLWL